MTMYFGIIKDSEASRKAWLKRKRKDQPSSGVSPADSFAEARKVAKENGFPELVTTKAGLERAVINFFDKRWEKMTDEEREFHYFRYPDVPPSQQPRELADAKRLASDFYRHEKKYNNIDPLQSSDEQKAILQNLSNFNHTLPAFRKAYEKYGDAPIVPLKFGERTSTVQGASGEYQLGLVLMDSNWIIPKYHKYEESLTPKGSSPMTDNTVYLNQGLAGTLRHEYGHHIHVNSMPRDKAREWDDLHTKVSGLEGKWNANNTEMGYDKHTPLKQISSYSQANSMESFAETFALMTSPTFDRKKYEPEVQPLFDFMEKRFCRDYVYASV